MIHSLEARRHLDASLSNGTLAVTGTGGADTVALSIAGGGIRVTLNGVATDHRSVKRISISTLAGDDEISIAMGISRNATIDAGDGNDAIAPGLGNDLVVGGAGNDVIVATEQLNFADRDTLDGGTGDDTLIGNSGDDVLIGGAGNDSLEDFDGRDALLGGDGNDRITVSAASFTVGSYFDGGAGEDVFDFSLINDPLNLALLGKAQLSEPSLDASLISYGFFGALGAARRARLANYEQVLSGGGDDKLVINFQPIAAPPEGNILTQNYTVDAGGGEDSIFYASCSTDAELASLDNTTLRGGAGDDFITYDGYSSPRPTVDAGTGDDLVEHTAGVADVSEITFGAGSDTYRLSDFHTGVSLTMPGDLENAEIDAGLQTLVGNALDNRISVGAIGQSLDALGGNDRIFVREAVGIATISGGDGDDRIDVQGGSGNDGPTVRGGAGNDRVSANGSWDVFGDAGNDRIVLLTGGDAIYSVNGGSGNDLIHGSIRGDVIDLVDGERDLYFGNDGGDEVDADEIDVVLQISPTPGIDK